MPSNEVHNPVPTRRVKLDIETSTGARLAALLETPMEQPLAYGIFAHCFTCSKDILAASRITRALAGQRIAVVRFDFTGLGNSDGDFANTNFSSNVEDLLEVADHLRRHYRAPALLVGHSLGGAAVLAAAAALTEVRAVATIGAPSDPGHVKHLFVKDEAAIVRDGEAVVQLAGRPFKIRKQFLDDLDRQRLTDQIRSMRKALLVMHAPKDDTVEVENAAAIFGAALHPKSFVSLDGADHLLTRATDSTYAAAVIAAWAGRYVVDDASPAPELAENEVKVEELDGKFMQLVSTGDYRLLADEPHSVGGQAAGPTPYDLLLSGLGACTNMTLRMYAKRRGLKLDHVSVTMKHDKIHAKDCDECETQDGRIDRIQRVIELVGDLSEQERASLLRIADRCPVHRTLHSEVNIKTHLG